MRIGDDLMQSLIYGLNYDYIYKDGHYLVVAKSREEGFLYDSVTNIPIKMMQSNKIPRLLPMVVEDIDFQIRFNYELTSKRMLTHYLKENSLPLADFYSLLIHIIAALEDSKVYMLSTDNYVLHEDFIFIGKDINDIYLTYLPLQSITEKPKVVDELRELILKLVESVSQLDGEHLKRLLQYLKDPAFNLVEFRKIVTELRVDKHAIPEITPKERKSQTINRPIPKAIHERPFVQQQESVFNPFLREHHKISDNPSIHTKLPALTQRQKVVMFAVSALIIALVWKLYVDNPQTSNLVLCTILSVLLLIGMSIFAFIWRPGQPVNLSFFKTAKSHKTIKKHNRSSSMDIFPNHIEEPIQSIQRVTTDRNKPVVEKTDSYYKNLNNRTTLFANIDETVLLNEHKLEDGRNGENIHFTQPRLRLERDGKTIEIEVNQEHFIIGRNPDVAQYVEDSNGVSRAHVEIMLINDMYGIKDLGSKNGTSLNDQLLVPYKVYPLNHEDVISIGTVRYVFLMR